MSNFDSSSVTNMNSIFSGCNGLVALYLSNLNLDRIETATNMFQNTENLKYIKLNVISNNVTNTETMVKILNDELNNRNLIVCQNKNLLANSNFKYCCCDFNIEKEKCLTNNYIKIKYNTDGNYENGFGNDIRRNISFIYKENSFFLADENLSYEKKMIL